mmetsp:Transcript_75563/g.204257  ORF Transcript_75563/g.204257 Transcript_75563/m.204257 type:complete len:263 (+) Transcript_75563:96-884(+)
MPATRCAARLVWAAVLREGRKTTSDVEAGALRPSSARLGAQGAPRGGQASLRPLARHPAARPSRPLSQQRSRGAHRSHQAGRARAGLQHSAVALVTLVLALLLLTLAELVRPEVAPGRPAVGRRLDVGGAVRFGGGAVCRRRRGMKYPAPIVVGVLDAYILVAWTVTVLCAPILRVRLPVLMGHQPPMEPVLRQRLGRVHARVRPRLSALAPAGGGAGSGGEALRQGRLAAGRRALAAGRGACCVRRGGGVVRLGPRRRLAL